MYVCTLIEKKKNKVCMNATLVPNGFFVLF